MKRSEALQLIHDVLITERSRMIGAEKILTELEKVGMVAPEILNPKAKEEPVYDPNDSVSWIMIKISDYYRGEIPYNLKVNQWEEE